MGVMTNLTQDIHRRMVEIGNHDLVRMEYRKLKNKLPLTNEEYATLRAAEDYLADLGEMPVVSEGHI